MVRQPPLKEMKVASIQVIAQEADKIFDAIMKIEPTAASVASMFVPGAAPVVAMVQPELLLLAPAIDKALEDLAAGANPLQAVAELMMHITKGMPNAPALAPVVASDASQAASG